VFFMALGRLDEIGRGLLSHGVDAATPAAVVASGTTDAQEVAFAPLERIAEAATGLQSPALLVVGDVVGLAPLLACPPEMIAAHT
jgi:uroporphyrin-III C-methyltransferase / precorrin-2 dehydrogenase / sirohydrochlorin ferrochelatase